MCNQKDNILDITQKNCLSNIITQPISRLIFDTRMPVSFKRFKIILALKLQTKFSIKA